MLRMLEAQAPAKQTATDTISTLSSRLTNATLLEDRRGAILGLRSFAKEFPASVASGSLRGLISCLTKDAEDVDTIKVVLETLLMLFNPNETSPEASDEIALWLADEFTQRQDNITILLDLLETHDFYSRLYALQIIQAISSARPDRTQECVLTAPFGTTRLVATLDDTRDAVRNAGLMVLNDLSQSSTELQKLFVFENAFERVFSLIDAEGSLLQGGIIVQDCLSLLANLVHYNASNQTAFRETGGVARLAALLPEPAIKKAKSPGPPEDDWTSPQKDKNIWGLLAIVRMFLLQGSTSTLLNQNAFQKHGLLQKVLNMAFDKSTTIPIKVEALNTCADMIRGNARLQEGFAQLQVSPLVQTQLDTNGDALSNGVPKVYVIDALLDLALSPASTELFDARFAACECIKAYFYNHTPIRLHFLKRAIDGHVSGADETANVLTTLVAGPQGSQTIDPYRTWFAAILVLHLIYDDREGKDLLMAVEEGDAESGEEVVTCIQAITGNLIASLQIGEDERISIGYLMLLCGWLFEDANAVNDFLNEGSSLESLVNAASKPGADLAVIRGLCAALLGIIYEFSTKDSPISRRDLQPFLTTRLGREKYLDAITNLRQHPLVRDFEVSSHASSGNLPEVYFDTTFVDFLKDNFSRLSRTIDRDPGLEIHQTEQGIDRDLVDSLRGQLDEKIQALEKAQAELLAMEQKLNQELADHRKTQDQSLTQLNTIKRINEDLHRTHDEAAAKLDREHRQATLDLENKHNLQLAALNTKLAQAQKETPTAVAKTKQEYESKLHDLSKALRDAEARNEKTEEERGDALETIQSFQATQRRTKDEIALVRQTISSLEAELKKAEDESEALKEEKATREAEVEKLKADNRQLKTEVQENVWKVKDAQDKMKKAEKGLEEKEAERKAVQTELDDLFVVLGDLEEKRGRDKERLKALGEEISDAEDEEEEGEGEDEDAEDSDAVD
ncbi:intracellular protein transport protein [Lophium mytilinum]|uniref:Intracellular protein transport protein n=1 Tax=Lophium mytilinum TaxID=390894 RepID=A0A6A6QAD0_9PEZI|nr:intracellular protein transport protein [Lophium mytilinum]